MYGYTWICKIWSIHIREQLLGVKWQRDVGLQLKCVGYTILLKLYSEFYVYAKISMHAYKTKYMAAD